GQLNWPHVWLDKYPMLNSIAPPITTLGNDKLEWHDMDGVVQPFSVQTVWNTIRPRCDKVWFKVKRLAGLSNSMPSIDSIIHDIIPFAKRKSSRSIIAKLVVAATTYFIWQERNNRMFKKSKRSVEQVADCIINVVRFKLLSCKWKKSKAVCDIIGLWNLAFHMAQHVIPAAQLVPQYKPIGRCNNYAVLQSIPCSPECKIVGLILLDHYLSHALTATADVPDVYLQQFWRTVSKVPDTKDTIKFLLDTEQLVYTVDMFRDTFQLLVETPENPFFAPANIHNIEAFMNRVGYQGVVDKNFWKSSDQDQHSSVVSCCNQWNTC
ncbi:hypothetical protein Tco_1452747, partial [Tanacetum coccineum]